MTTDTIFPPGPPRSARPARSRRAPARWRRPTGCLIPRRGLSRASVRLTDAALHELMQEGDIYRIGRRHFFVAPISAELLDTLIVATGATEDIEEDDPAEANGDEESSLGWGQPGSEHGRLTVGRSDDDLEGDGDCDAEPDVDDEPDVDAEPDVDDEPV